MCGRNSESTSLTEPSGPIDEQFVYQLTEAGLKVLEEHTAATGTAGHARAVPMAAISGALRAEHRRRRRAEQARRRRAEQARRARDNGRRPGTVSALRRDGAAVPVPYLRIAGEWLRQAGFDIGCNYEVAIDSGRLTIQLHQA